MDGGGQSNAPPPISSWPADTSFKDDVTVLFLLGASFTTGKCNGFAPFYSTISRRLSGPMPREYWMIYRGPGFLAVVWFGSTPILSPSPVFFSGFLFIVAGRDCRRWGGVGEEPSGEKAWSSIYHPILSAQCSCLYYFHVREKRRAVKENSYLYFLCEGSAGLHRYTVLITKVYCVHYSVQFQKWSVLLPPHT